MQEAGRLKRYADVVSGGVLLIVGIVMLIETKNIRALRIMEFGPKIMPRLYSLALMGLGAAIGVSGFLRGRRDPSSSQSANLGKIDLWKVLITMGLIVFYVVGLRPFGFLATTLFYLFFQILVLGGVSKKWRLLIYGAVAIVVSVGIYFLFTRVFHVFLPPGRIW